MKIQKSKFRNWMSDLVSFTMRPKTFWNRKLYFTHYFLKFKSQPVNWANITISREIVDNFKNSKLASLCMHVVIFLTVLTWLMYWYQSPLKSWKVFFQDFPCCKDYLVQNRLLFQPIFDVHDQQWFLMKVKTIRNVIKINNNKQVHKVENVNGGR